MYIEAVPNRNSPYRQDGKIGKRTLCNLSHWPTAHIEGLRGVLKGGTVIPAEHDAFTVTRTLPHGHVAAALGTARKIGLDRVLGPDGNRCHDLVLARRAHRRSRCHGRRLHTDARYRAGGGIDVPRSGGTDDHPGAGRQGCRRRGGECPSLALDETPAASMPSSLSALHECPQHLVDPRRRYASPSLVAVAQQARELADRPIGPFIGGDPSRRGRDDSAGALVDEERGNRTGIWSHAGGEPAAA